MFHKHKHKHPPTHTHTHTHTHAVYVHAMSEIGPVQSVLEITWGKGLSAEMTQHECWVDASGDSYLHP